MTHSGSEYRVSRRAGRCEHHLTDCHISAIPARQSLPAEAYAMAGCQALHLHRIIVSKNAPRCFVAAVNRGEDIAHLFDQDKERLIKTAKKLGVRVIVVEHEGTPGQHVDLCGAPLRKAMWTQEPACVPIRKILELHEKSKPYSRPIGEVEQ